jgi:CheY-like chemotaxis protein
MVFLDISLRKMGAYEVTQTIRQRSWGEKIVLIAVIGWGQETDKRASQLAGFDCHLVKLVAPPADSTSPADLFGFARNSGYL